MAKSEKLKQLEKLMEHAGMRGADGSFLNSKALQQVASGGTNSSSTPAPPKKSSKLASSISSSIAPSPTTSKSGNFRAEVALKETREEFENFKKVYYGLKKTIDTLLSKQKEIIIAFDSESIENAMNDADRIEGLLKDVKQFQEYLQAESDEKKKLFQSYQNLIDELHSISLSLDIAKDSSEQRFYDSSILIIQDSITHRKMLQVNLEALNYRNIISAKSPKEALQILDRYSKDDSLPEICLITFDADMAVNSSPYEMAQILRHPSFIKKYPGYKKIPIIMFASKFDKLLLVEASKAGVNDFIRKPIDRRTLEEKISKFLA